VAQALLPAASRLVSTPRTRLAPTVWLRLRCSVLSQILTKTLTWMPKKDGNQGVRLKVGGQHRLGGTPYNAPHLSVRGTLTLLNNVLLCTHFRLPTRRRDVY
jgi:hypothetical protein